MAAPALTRLPRDRDLPYFADVVLHDETKVQQRPVGRVVEDCAASGGKLVHELVRPVRPHQQRRRGGPDPDLPGDGVLLECPPPA